MARLNVWVPDELAERARAHGLNVSALTQAALLTEMGRRDTDAWLDQRTRSAADDAARPARRLDHSKVLAALDATRDDIEAGGPSRGDR